MDVKEARKNYEFIKANQGKPEATNEEYIKFKAALKTSGHIMNLIVTYQKKFDGISNSPLAAAVPAISITIHPSPFLFFIPKKIILMHENNLSFC